MIRKLLVTAGLMTLAIASACGSQSSGTPAPACVTGLTTSCAATYDPPTYATIHAKILQPTCATGNGTCHTADARQGGLSFASESESYALLLGQNGAHARVAPGDPACSLIVERLHSADPSLHMPPGPTSVSAGDLCTIVKWIAAGANP